MNLKHCMLDIETLGTGTHAAIKSIGALTFDPMTSQVMDVRDTRAFHRLIDLSKSKHAGVIDAAHCEPLVPRHATDARGHHRQKRSGASRESRCSQR